MDKSKAIEFVRKLKVLAEDDRTPEHERATARYKIKVISEKYGLMDIDPVDHPGFEFTGVEETPEYDQYDEPVDFSNMSDMQFAEFLAKMRSQEFNAMFADLMKYIKDSGIGSSGSEALRTVLNIFKNIL